MHLGPSLLSLFLAFGSSLSSPIADPDSRQAQNGAGATVTDIWDFPLGTWVENLAVRSNGQILVTLLNLPEVYQADPTLKTPATLVHSFPDYLSCAGITELGSDIFYVVVGNFSTATITTGPGSYSVWKLNLNGFVPGGAAAAATHIADFPESIFFNGITSVSSSGVTLLIADSRGTDIWSVNVATGAINKTVTDPLLAGLTTGEDIGVNGIKVRSGELYFTNTDQALLAREAINSQGESEGTAATVTSGLTSVDDFAFDSEGNIFFAGNNVLRVQKTGESVVTTVSNDSLLIGSTAVEFARGANGNRSAYVTTNGGADQFETKNFTVPGRLVKVSF